MLMSRAATTQLIYCALFILLLCAPKPGHAQNGADDPFRFVRWMGTDLKAVPRALIHPRPVQLGVGAASIFAVSRFDRSLSEELTSWQNRELMRVFEEVGDANAARPAAVLIFAGSLLQDNHRVQDAAFASLEALIFANILTNALKELSGRSRPWQEKGPDHWEPFSGGTSFPSGHATTAFAAVTPWLIYFPHPLSYIAAGVAATTSISRTALRFHWPSDIVAGGFIGYSVSAWLVRRHTSAEEELAEDRVSPIIGPSTLGVRLSIR